MKYTEEALELVAALEKSLLQIENNPDDPNLIEAIFRDMHTLKGNSSMFGFKIITDFTHHLESIYDLVRRGEMNISSHILNVTFSSLDHLSSLINNGNTMNEEENKIHEQLSEKVIQIINSPDKYTGLNSPVINAHETISINPLNKITTWHIHFCPDKDFLLNGSNPLSLVNELYELGECQVTANIDNIPLPEDFDVESCYTSWDIYLSTIVDIRLIREVFQFAEDRCNLIITEVLNNTTPAGPAAVAENNPGIPNRMETLKSDSILLPNHIEKTEHNHKRQVISSIRVPSERLDNLMSLVSELMTLQAKLSTIIEQNPQTELLAVTENLEKISTRLRDNAFSMCLLPVENMVTPFHRLVRDLAAELNKEIEFITEGTETELDKNIMEGLADPIMQNQENQGMAPSYSRRFARVQMFISKSATMVRDWTRIR